ncbi:GNAT family N-acetyltransferase [Nocardiopsis lambiniae]|uniref:GNAT family N-acetyltransferase n=1 Tax=Nocardiopsis lambiniae TaxID=3075539 RepID=A0ABU2M4A5_9ACTN|nr:GNAT family N-acetyltransferase [Nocardiopsis sp. DSM 44743]MDT0327460.1 GNAT family N-acetyltransferase [Nocardiopsis sp. DSM 44743]
MRADDEARAVEVSLAAEVLFERAGVLLPPDDPRELFAHADRLLVAVDAGVVTGLAATVPLDGGVHLEQLSVHPDHGRSGIGSALLEEVCAEAAVGGSPRVTLTTFRDLPWNGPWYTARGFSVLPEEQWGEGMRALWADEEPIRVRPRVAMARPTG